MDTFICQDPGSVEILKTGRVLVRAGIPILITGETGTGKEALARCLAEKGRPFVTVDCAILNRDTARSELFGATKGAYTGAVADRHGLVVGAEGGTLFIDEVGEAPPEVQMGLLRFLQTGEYVRMGETRSRKVATQVVCATNRDLEEEVRAGRFRRDLYYRIAVGRLRMPPLRERPDDLRALIGHFSSKYASITGRPEIARSQMLRLLDYDWPGNVRQLENEIALMFAGVKSDLGEATEPEVSWMSEPFDVAKKVALEEAVRRYIERRLVATSGNVTEASVGAGVGRQCFQQWMKRVGIRASDYRH